MNTLQNHFYRTMNKGTAGIVRAVLSDVIRRSLREMNEASEMNGDVYVGVRNNAT